MKPPKGVCIRTEPGQRVGDHHEVRVSVTLSRWFRLRLWLACKLVGLAFRIAPQFIRVPLAHKIGESA